LCSSKYSLGNSGDPTYHGLTLEKYMYVCNTESETESRTLYFLSSNESAGSIHSVAEALLMLIDSFAEPVIPYQFYYRCIEGSSNETLCKQVTFTFI